MSTGAGVDEVAWARAVAGVLRKSGRLGDVDPADDPGSLAAALEALTTRTVDGIPIRPLYTAAEAPVRTGYPGLGTRERGSRPQGCVETGWDVRALHADPDVALTRAAARTDLENGASSLWLRLGASAIAVGDLGEALGDVRLQLAPVVLDAGLDAAQAGARLLEVLDERGVARPAAGTNLGVDAYAAQARSGDPSAEAVVVPLVRRCLDDGRGVRVVTVDALPYHEAGGSDADELGCVLAAGVAHLRLLHAAGVPEDAALSQLEFRYAATTDQFLTIAKLRAARRCWARVVQLCSAPEEVRGQRQHAVTSWSMTSRIDPYVNVLRATVAALAAGLGGADAVTVLPFDTPLGLPTGFSRRLARNTASVLVREAHLARVIDPAGGSWYVEQLTDHLARAAWSVFQRIERAGGIGAGLRSGMVGDLLASSAAERADRVTRRELPITGVSEFPSPDLPTALATDVPASSQGSPGGLPRLRTAEPFERLRSRAASLARSSGRPPTVLIAAGSTSGSASPVALATDLFAAGGVSVSVPNGRDEPTVGVARRSAGTTVACLCPDGDADAETLASQVAALRGAGATTVLLSGGPLTRVSGVDGHIYVGCDAVGILTTALDALGAPP